jgi:hypothetical protein
MRAYQRIGPNTGISASIAEIGFFGFLVLVGLLPFLALAVIVYAALWAIAMILVLLLAVNGIIFKWVTGRDARVPLPGAEGDSRIEHWMEEQGWIRLPKRL